MTDAKENSKAAFDQQAATYDRDVKGRHARALYPVILEKLSRIPYHTALDLGCGTGELMRRILEKDGSKVLYGLDLSEQMLETAKRSWAERSISYWGTASTCLLMMHPSMWYTATTHFIIIRPRMRSSGRCSGS